MKRSVLSDFAVGLLIPLSIFLIFSIGMETVVFGYFNRAELTARGEIRTFLNTILPFTFTVGCIIYFTLMQIFSSLKNRKKNLFYLILAIFSGIIAVPWQIDWLLWHFQKEKLDYLYIGIWLLVLVLSIGIVIDGVRTYWPGAKGNVK